MLCAGCFEDTAYEALCKMGYPVKGIDPQTDGHDGLRLPTKGRRCRRP
jgi:hypothetical protein